MIQKETLPVRKKNLEITRDEIEIEKLKFYPENPRVYDSIRFKIGGRTPTEKEIENALIETEDVQALAKDIKGNGGLTDPVIVRQETFEVVEGNRRLAAYRQLRKDNSSDPKWKKIRCILVHDATDSDINSVLGQYHLKGKKEWKPYEQAGFIYRRQTLDKISPKEISKEFGITPNKAERFIEVYSFMQKHGESKEFDRWSYYYSYINTRTTKGKNSSVSKAREKNPELDKIIVEKIRNKEIKTAMHLRDRLPHIVASRKVFNAFLRGESTFDEAWSRVENSGSTNDYVVRLKRFRDWLADNEKKIKKELGKEKDETRDKVRFEVNKIKTIIKNFKTD